MINVNAQLGPNDKVFLVFEEIEGKESVDGNDAIVTLKSYITGKTTLTIVDNKEVSQFYFKLNVIISKKKRLAKIVILNSKTEEVIFESEWMKGSGMNQYYGYSGTRMAIGKLVKNDVLDAFPEISD
jgi:hypothetical protein